MSAAGRLCCKSRKLQGYEFSRMQGYEFSRIKSPMSSTCLAIFESVRSGTIVRRPAISGAKALRACRGHRSRPLPLRPTASTSQPAASEPLECAAWQLDRRAIGMQLGASSHRYESRLASRYHRPGARLAAQTRRSTPIPDPFCRAPPYRYRLTLPLSTDGIAIPH
jgi:hypothetical protein